jgi:hypothetical protein
MRTDSAAASPAASGGRRPGRPSSAAGTAASRGRRPPRPSTATTTAKVVVLSLAAAAALAGGLAVQMAQGHDPALGAGGQAPVAVGNDPRADTAQPTGPPVSVVTRAS